MCDTECPECLQALRAGAVRNDVSSSVFFREVIVRTADKPLPFSIIFRTALNVLIVYPFNVHGLYPLSRNQAWHISGCFLSNVKNGSGNVK